jgi:hypothetical protein
VASNRIDYRGDVLGFVVCGDDYQDVRLHNPGISSCDDLPADCSS